MPLKSEPREAQQALEPLPFEVQAQQVLDELWREKAIPFALKVGKLEQGMGEYTIHFHDSRMHTARVPLSPHRSFRDAVRMAVLARVAQMSGQLKKSPQRLGISFQAVRRRCRSQFQVTPLIYFPC